MPYKPSPFLKYTGLAFEMIAALILGGFLGHWLDTRWQNKTPYCTMLFAFLGLAAAFWHFILSIKNTNDKD